MSAGRRTTRATKRRNPGDDDTSHPEHVQGQHEVSPVMSRMGIEIRNPGVGGWQMGHLVPFHSIEGADMAYQYQHGTMPYQYSQQFGAPSSGIPIIRGRKGATATAPVPSTSAAAMNPTPSTSGTQQPRMEQGEADPDEEEEEEDNENSGTAAKAKTSLKMETTLTVDQMVQSCLFFFLVQQNKKFPVKRSDLIKNAMNSQHKQFDEVMQKLETVLNEVFGIKIILVGKGKDSFLHVIPKPGEGGNAATEEETEEPQPGPSSGRKVKGKGISSAPPSYILCSNYPISVYDHSMHAMERMDPEADCKKSTLYLILTVIFMLNHPIDEDIIWKIIYDMGFVQMVCKKREDLRKFLKSEYVMPAYLNMETTEQDSHPNAGKHSSKEHASNDGEAAKDLTKAKYSWGPRAEKEFSKYAMLKFVVERFPDKQMYEFTVQYNMVQRQGRDAIDRDLFEERDTDGEHDKTAAASASAAKNGSALKIKQKPGGRGETFSIDGENTETETEGAE